MSNQAFVLPIPLSGMQSLSQGQGLDLAVAASDVHLFAKDGRAL